MGRSRGTLPVQLGGNVRRGGLIELAFGISLREIIEDLGGGTLSGRPIRAVQVGGPLGAYLTAAQLDVAMDYEALAAIKGMLGHGGIVVFDDSVDMAQQARFAFAFCAKESCGKCTPCRIGATRGVETMDKIIAGTERPKNLAKADDGCLALRHGRADPEPGSKRAQPFPRGFRPAGRACEELAAGCRMRTLSWA